MNRTCRLISASGRNGTLFVWCSFLVAVIVSVLAAQAPITRIDFYDAAGNRLLYVENVFDAQNLPTGRDVYAPDGFLFRSTQFENSAGRRLNEVSKNFDSQPAGAVGFTYSGTKTTFSVRNKFDATLFQGVFDGAVGQPSYSVATAQGQPIAALNYQYDSEGIVSRIDINQSGGSVVAYAQITRGTIGNRQTSPISSKGNRQVLLKGDYLYYSIPQGKPLKVRCELFDFSGRRIATPVSGTFEPGRHGIHLQGRGVSGGAVKIVRLTIGNQLVYQGMYGNAGGASFSMSGATVVHTIAGKSIGKVTASAEVRSQAQELFFDERTAVSPALVVELLFRNRDLDTPRRPLYASPGVMAISPDKSTIYVAQEGRKRLSVVDPAAKTTLREISLPNIATGIAVSHDGASLFVTCASDIWPSGFIHKINAATGAIQQSIVAGHSVRSPVLSPDGKTLYVCNWFDNNVGIIDIAAGTQVALIPVVREPYSAALTPDGSMLVVNNSLPFVRSNDPDTLAVTSVVSLVNTSTRKIDANIRLPIGSHSLFGTAISADGKYAFVTHLVGKFSIIADQLASGWVHTNNCAIIDLEQKKFHNSFTLDQLGSGAANPWGVACTEDGSKLYVVHAGSCEISEINLVELLKKAATTDLSHSLSGIATIRQRIRTRGKGPRNIVLGKNSVFVGVYFSDSLEYRDFGASTSVTTGAIGLVLSRPLTSERIGERHFFDGSLCFQGWQSCSSCHPFTRPDGLNWILARLNNTPKNAKSMLHAHYTPPTNWTGRRVSSWQSIEAGIEIELMMHPDVRTVSQIDSFFMALRPVPSPHLARGRLSEPAKRGKELFMSSRLDCKMCHNGQLYQSAVLTHGFVNDLYDNTPTWKVPSLNESWRTSPYDHLGSSLTIEEVIKYPGHSSNISKLTRSELDDLVEYILSL